jgi:hypothetical protein
LSFVFASHSSSFSILHSYTPTYNKAFSILSSMMSHLVQQEIKEYFASQPEAQLNALLTLIQNIQDDRAKNLSTQYVQSPMRKKSKGAASSRAKAAKPGVHPAGLILAAKRPLNSWMAFRAYYATIFTTFQQKNISGFLTRMWQEDPFKAKWAIVAKAYSIIRDKVGKAHAPLDIFLQTVCPHIGKPDPYDVSPTFTYAG